MLPFISIPPPCFLPNNKSSLAHPEFVEKDTYTVIRTYESDNIKAYRELKELLPIEQFVIRT